MTMLVLFNPTGWRSGTDLRAENATWEKTFEHTEFEPQHVKVMQNMNVLYECLDARDDFAAQRRAAGETFAFGFMSNSHEDGGSADCAEAQEDKNTESDMAQLLSESGCEIGKHTMKIRTEMAHITNMMSTTRTSGKNNTGVALTSADAASLPYSNTSKTAVEWKALLDCAKRDEIARREGYVRTERKSRIDVVATGFVSVRAKETPVRVITQADWDRLIRHGLDTSRGPQDSRVQILHEVADTFSLNEEQLRAFEIAAMHLIHHSSEPLRMYLGGMGGTGKSRVVSSLTYYLVCCGEEYRFAVLGPTGSSASLIDGATYHSVLGFGHQSIDNSHASISALEKVRGRFSRVDLVFIDEVSMVSCSDLYRISSQLTKAFSNPEQSFGGKSVLLAGDFGQLPPAGGGQTPLYSDSVNAWSSAQKPHEQRNAIGKALWHSFTTVVILKQNMRQTGVSDEDNAFQTALSNMRYKCCTKEDIALLNRRVVPRANVDEILNTPRFRDVSIITARNSHRDAINKLKQQQYADTHGKCLHHFYSLDTWAKTPESSSVRATQRRNDRTFDPVRSTNSIDPAIQNALWNLAPSLTEHHAGILSLCVGMPVLLKSNEATELCVTNGAEAEVYGWNSSTLPSGKTVLDTLFVKLLKPPRAVQLEGLPVNVCTNCACKCRIACTMQTDDVVKISREQVTVLPNFAMTDFASQGRTRPTTYAPKFCRNHQSLYTVFSRSASLQGTVILEGFDEGKLRGGASSALRREFRELDILDDITCRRSKGMLPEGIVGGDRAELIRSYERVFRSEIASNSVRSFNTSHDPFKIFTDHVRGSVIMCDFGQHFQSFVWQ
ncbi:ATP-dependent DNA helicase PIF1 [Grifola frondosa]|uniref:ATP-dependent DNA helicase n=1 Tax=Grifola frondosa TaxID=5627 RepID=A0A1C7MDK0_GRIFR|nr:ATP-dependent DNA helicase PIF1 [Grifola frondosa]